VVLVLVVVVAGDVDDRGCAFFFFVLRRKHKQNEGVIGVAVVSLNVVEFLC
jgi:hypothetical protein|tara:strand:+ start:515 stop:667 length:153 start_codon:yes stop_codon:yes gene_type:complete